MTAGQRTLDEYADTESGGDRDDETPPRAALAARVDELDERTETLAEITEQFGEQLERLLDAADVDGLSDDDGAEAADEERPPGDNLRMFQ